MRASGFATDEWRSCALSSRTARGRWSFIAPRTPGLVWDSFSTPDGSIIGGTSLGLIGWRNGRSQTMTAANKSALPEIHTLLRDSSR